MPIKINSVRCPEKNLKLFPFVINSLSSVKNHIVIASEDKECIELAKKYNLETYYFESQYTSDTNILYHYANDNNLEYFFHFPFTQPYKDLSFINKALEYIDEYDLICSSVMHTNRQLFYVENGKFIIPNSERKGSLCKDYEMIDGSMYLIKTNFLSSCIDENNIISNYKFWNTSKIKTILCNHPFIDIDTLYDMSQFEFILNHSYFQL